LEALADPPALGLGPDGAAVGVADVELLAREAVGGGVDGAVEDDVVHVVERAGDVEEQLGAVPAAHGDDGVPALGPALDGHGGARAAVRVRVVERHELVQAAVGVRDGGRGDGRRGAAVASDEVAEAGQDAAGLAAEERDAAEPAAVRPRARLHHAAAHVG
jgi:hypothetical protein